MNKIIKINVLLSTVITASAGILIGSQAMAHPPEEHAQAQTTTQNAVSEMTATFAIEKMTCATCPISVKKAMKRVDGVKSVKIDFKTKIANVVYDPELTTPTKIAAASTDVGYPASEVMG